MVGQNPVTFTFWEGLALEVWAPWKFAPPPWKNPGYAPDFEGSHNSYLGVIHSLMGSYNKIFFFCILHDPCRFCHVRKINVTVRWHFSLFWSRCRAKIYFKQFFHNIAKKTKTKTFHFSVHYFSNSDLCFQWVYRPINRLDMWSSGSLYQT